MEIRRKKNVATEIVFPMVDSTAPELFVTGETVADEVYYHDGGSWTSLAITDTVTEIGATGVYQLSLTSPELNHDLIAIKLTATNSVDQFIIISTGVVVVDLDTVIGDVVAGELDVGEDISLKLAIRALFNRFYREVTQSTAAQVVKNDSDVAIATMVTSDVAGTQTKGVST